MMQNRVMVALLCVIIGLAGLNGQAQAQPGVGRMHLHLDPAATEVHYTLKDTLHTVHGTFHVSSGEISFNPTTGEATGKVEVDVNSGASGNDTRDGKMKKEYLEAVKFPLASFEPQKVTGFTAGASSQTITVAGVMTLHGAGHPMTLQFVLVPAGTQVTATTSFKIPYVAWGVKDPSIPFVKVEKEVTMEITAKGTLQAE